MDMYSTIIFIHRIMYLDLNHGDDHGDVGDGADSGGEGTCSGWRRHGDANAASTTTAAVVGAATVARAATVAGATAASGAATTTTAFKVLGHRGGNGVATSLGFS